MTRLPEWQAVDLVPLADRIRYMRMFRLIAATGVVAACALLPRIREAGLVEVAIASGVYVLLSLSAEGVTRLSQSRSLHTFGWLLLVDGVYLAWVSYVTGGAAGPLPSLVVVHLIAVALLASFRTGVKIAMWHSLLMFSTFYAQEGGLIDAYGSGPAEFGDAQFRLLVIWTVFFWAVTLATATFAAVNERELRRQRYDLEALAQLAQRLERVAEAEAVAGVVVETMVEDFGFERVALLGAHDEELLLLDERGCGHETQPPGPDSVLWEAMRRGETILVSSLDPEADQALCEVLPDARNLIILPFHADRRAVGVLVGEHGMRRGSRVERRVVSVLERLASQSAFALENAWLLEQVQRMANTDGLTGLANRAKFDRALELEIDRTRSTGAPLSLLMVDLDHFKQLNDEHGHQVGDLVLRRVANALTHHSRQYDTIARYGGEEFSVLLPGVDESEAADIAERLRELVTDFLLDYPVTTSVGVAAVAGEDADGAELVKTADVALYAAKRAGRDRVTLASAVNGTGDLQSADFRAGVRGRQAS